MMKDRVRVTVARRTTPDGATDTNYSFECLICAMQYHTRSEQRVRLSCRVHRWLCRGYYFPGSIDEQP